MTKQKMLVPAVAVALGVGFLVAQSIGGHPGDGLVSLAIMVAFAALIAFGARRSETLRAVRGDGRDERFRAIDVQATAISGFVLIVAVLAAFAVELVRGNDGSPFDWLAAIAGVTYAVALAVLTRRG